MRSVNEINQRTAQRIGQHMAQNPEDYSRDAASYHAAAKAQDNSKRTVMIVLIAILALLLAAAAAFAVFIVGVSNQLNRGDKTDDELLAIEDALGGYSSNFKDPFYMLLLGSDARPGETASRTDTNIVARIDPINDQITLLSIPRDTKVEIPGHGTQKFNAAYAFGKVPGAIAAAEKLLGIQISHYAEVNFSNLAALIDSVGGVTVDVEYRIDDWRCDDYDGNHYIIEKGEQKLSGAQSLTFARARHYANGDFTRQSNQRKLIQAVVEKVLAAPVTNIPGIIGASVKCVTTDLKLMDIIGLAQQFADKKDIVMYSAMVPSYTQTINGISFAITDESKLAQALELFTTGKDPSGIVSNIDGGSVSTGKVDTSETLIFEDDVPDSDAVPNAPPSESESPENADSGSSSSTSTSADPDESSSEEPALSGAPDTSGAPAVAPSMSED